jgi:hypothetical protein
MLSGPWRIVMVCASSPGHPTLIKKNQHQLLVVLYLVLEREREREREYVCTYTKLDKYVYHHSSFTDSTNIT